MNTELQQIVDSLQGIEKLLEAKALQEQDSDESVLMQSIASSLDKLSGAQTIKGEKGDKGDTGDTGADGYTPIKGKDYYTKAEIKELVDKIRGMVKDGVDGKNGKDGRDGKDGKSTNGKDGRDGADGVNGKDGKDGTEITGEQIVSKHLALPKGKRISYDDLKDVPDVQGYVNNLFMGRPSNTMYVEDEGVRLNNGNPVEILNFTGAGVNVTYLNGRAIIQITGGAGNIPAQESGTISGTTITLAHTPVANTFLLYINGQFQHPSSDYSLSGTTVSGLPSTANGLTYTVTYEY